jgi:general secretion pathway protein K
MHCPRSNGFVVRRYRRRQQGVALIVAMLIFALAASLVVAMRSEFNRFYQRSANLLSDEQIQAYLRGGEELAAMVLIRDYDEDKAKGLWRDDLGETWADPDPDPYPLDGIGWMKGSLKDLQGRFNLNLLAVPVKDPSPTNRFTPEQEQFIRLLQALEEPAVSQQEAIMITESISDWLDENSEPSREGAEDSYYSNQTPAYRTANRMISSVSELRAVANMTPEIYKALEDFVTALPETSTTLNIHTAPAVLLRSINADKDLSPLSEDEGEALRTEGFENLRGLLENPIFAAKKDKMSGIQGLLDEKSAYFLLEAEVEVAGRKMRLYSVLERRNRKVSAIARGNGSL